MARFFKDRSIVKGKTPGSLVLIGRQKMEYPVLKFMQYNANELKENTLDSISEVPNYLSNERVSWLNIYGIHDAGLIKELGEQFSIHSILLEDILNTDQRPKFEYGISFNLFILKLLKYNEKNEQYYSEQVSLLISENIIITLQEQPGDAFEAVRERIRNKIGRVRQVKADYLLYVLLDTIVDNYMLLIEKMGVRIEDLEDAIFSNKEQNVAETIYTYKTEINFLRKAVRPVKDAMQLFFKSENSFFEEATYKYMRDLNDLVTQSAESIELYSNMLSDQLNAYSTSVSNKMNQVMKVLTIFASVFIPLTFLAGIYGMNFSNIPELNWKYGYHVFWGLTTIIVVGLLLFFRRKKWF